MNLVLRVFVSSLSHTRVLVNLLSHEEDTILAEKRCAKMNDFCMAALVFLIGDVKKARTNAHAEITHFPMRCVIKAWEARGP